MNDPRRVRVPWYCQRWHLRYILPALLFWFMAASALLGFYTSPIASVVATLFCVVIAVLFTRIVWQERFPLRSKPRHPGEVG